MRKLLTCLLIAAAGMASLSCDAPQANAPSAPSVAYEPPAPIDRAPLPPPAGYASAPVADSSVPVGVEVSSPYAGSAAPNSDHMIWQASPRWAAVKGDDQIEVQQDH
jgi:hypothetical protein